ncbi:MAG: hypothetical protein ACNA8H_10400 [Anaerolineales bacterium]
MPGYSHRRSHIHRMRIAAMLIAAFFFIWLPFEDVDVRAVVLLAIAICAWIGVRILIRPANKGKISIAYQALIGLLCGFGISPVAVGLMAVKTGLHGHPLPDFTPEQIYTVIWLSPYFGISGLLIGLGTGLLRNYLEKNALQS